MALNVDLANAEFIGGHLAVHSDTHGFSVARRSTREWDVRRVVGYNGAVGTTFSDVAEIGNVPILTAATAMEVVSSSASDTLVGTGAREVEIHGLDINYKIIKEVILLSGTTPVATRNSYLRINSFHVMQAGSGGVAAGNILLRGAGAGTTYSQITAGGNIMLQCFYTVPYNRMLYIHGWSAGATGKETRIVLRATRDWHDGSKINVFQFQDIIATQSATTYKPFEVPIRCEPKTDIKVSAQCTQAGATVGASIEMSYEDFR